MIDLTFFAVFQGRNRLAKEILSGTDLNAKKYVSQRAEVNQVVLFTTSNIAVRGIRLSRVRPAKPQDVDLLDDLGEGVLIPGAESNSIDLATVVKYSSIKDILSEDELEQSVDSSISSRGSLAIRSTIVSFSTEPQLEEESISEPFKIVVKNNEVWSCVIECITA